MFGDEEKQRVLLQVINANASVSEVTEQISGIFNQIIQHRNEKYFSLRDQITSKIHFKQTQERVPEANATGDLREASISSEGASARLPQNSEKKAELPSSRPVKPIDIN